jgi:hypothetical protein
MSDEPKWRNLCKSIIAEKDPARLWQLAEELSSILKEQERHQDSGLPSGSAANTFLTDESV